MQTDPRAVVERAARDLLSALTECPLPPTIRVAEVEGRSACLILVWDAQQAMPTLGQERRRRPGGPRADCKVHILEIIRAASQPQTRKEIVKALRRAGKHHGAGTVAKALADLTSTGELANPRDKKGYRLPEWMKRRRTPSLFD
jgi:hypothetical protein